MNNVNGGDDSIGTRFPLSKEDVVIENRKAIWHKFTHIHCHHYNLGFTLQEVTSFIIFFTIQYIFQLLFTHRIKPALLMFTDFILLQYAI